MLILDPTLQASDMCVTSNDCSEHRITAGLESGAIRLAAMSSGDVPIYRVLDLEAWEQTRFDPSQSAQLGCTHYGITHHARIYENSDRQPPLGTYRAKLIKDAGEYFPASDIDPHELRASLSAGSIEPFREGVGGVQWYRKITICGEAPRPTMLGVPPAATIHAVPPKFSVEPGDD